MKLREIIDLLEAEELFTDGLGDRELLSVCSSDLMSDVLTTGQSHFLMVTGLVNLQAVRTGEVADAGAICFVRGKKPARETVELAKDVGIPLICTKLSMMESCGRLYEKGMRGCDGVA